MIGCYNDQDFDEGEGAFTVRVDGTMITLLPALRSITEGAVPDVVKILKEDTDDNRFEDSLSSVQFLPDFAPQP
jgi:hypothetical protein